MFISLLISQHIRQSRLGANNRFPGPSAPKKAKLELLISKALRGAINPVMALNEILPGLKYECIMENNNKSSISPFVYEVKIEEVPYRGSGE